LSTLSTPSALSPCPLSGAAAVSAARSRVFCREVARTRAGNFYHGMRLVPEPKRSATYALYAWLRRADDLADDEGEPAEKVRRLDEFWDQTLTVLGGGGDADASPLWPAFREAAVGFGLPVATLREHVSGQLLDQRKTRYAEFDELYDYCRRVASTVGQLCIEIWGHDGSARARQLAEWRGVAFQLTNILRDVREDARRDRVYLPACDTTPEELIRGTADCRVLDEAVARAREYYERSRPLESHVHRDGVACLWAMTEIYRGVFERIERDPRQVFGHRRVGLPRWKKAWVAMRAVMA
jgi:phytoene synthase